MNRPLLLLTALALALTPAAAGAASPAATLAWQAEEGSGSLLLVLERGPEGWSLVDARTAAVAPKTRRGEGSPEDTVFALVDEAGRPLATGRLSVPAQLHGPVLDEQGEIRCVAFPLERATIAVRLPAVKDLAGLRLYAAAEFAPVDGPGLAAALSARAADAGLDELARFDLRAALEPRP